MPIITLKELENKKVLTLSHGFAGWNTMDMESGLNNIFLKNTKLIKNDTVLELIGETINKSEVTGYIRSDNSNLLRKIKNEIEKLKDKSISEVYYTKLDIGLNI